MNKQAGFTLVELMISVTLGLLLSSAAISAFVSVNRVSSSTSARAALANQGRFAFEQLGTAVRSAGYLGCSTSPDARVDLPATMPILVTDVSEPLAGYNYNAGGAFTLSPPYVPATNAGAWATSPNLGGALDQLIFKATVSGTAVGHPITGSDAIGMHGVAVGTAPLYLSATASVGVNTLSTTLTGTNSASSGFAALLAGGSLPVAAVANCQSAEVFALGSLNGSTFTLSTANTPQQLVTAYGAGSHLSLIDSRVYYIGVGSDGEGALFVLDDNGATAFSAPIELVPDVENMQVLYGVDTTGSATVGDYVTADAVATTGITGDFNSVIDVKVALLLVGAPASNPIPAAAPTFSLLNTTVTAPIDTRLRSVFTATFALRNSAG